MAEPTRDQLIAALRKADAAGDTEAAVAIARRIDTIDRASGESVGDASGTPPEGEVLVGYGTNEDGSRFPMYGPAEQQPAMVREREALARGAGTVVEGLAALPGLVVNPIGQAIYNATGYGDQTYDLGDILRSGADLPQMDEGVGRTVGEFASGGLGFGAAARGVNALLPYASQVTKGALSVLGRTPVRDAAAGGGAGLGLEVGGDVGQAVGGDTGRVAGEVVGTLAGGVGGYSAANRAFGRVAGERVLNETAQAAQDLNIQQIAADTGGRGSRFATGAVRSTFGGIPIAEGAEQASQSAGRAANTIAGRIGNVADDTAAGQAARRGVERFERQSAERATELYESIPVQTGASVELGSTRTALQELTKGFRSNPQLSELWANNPRMKATLEALTENPDIAGSGRLSWEDMKAFRSMVGEIIGQPGVTRDGSDIAQMRRLYGALSQDMEATARAQGPEAYQAWKRADQYWRGRQDRIESVFSTLLGKDGMRSDEQVYKSINSWAKDGGDFRRLARTIRSMPEDEANTIRATLVQRMGLAPKGQQAGEGTIFSPRKFATEWQGMDKRAKAVLFPDTKHRADLEKLAKVADGMKAADEFRNWSGTAVGVNAFITGSVGLANAPAAIALGLLQFGGGKLLASPKFARIMASTIELPTEKQARALTERLGVLAGQEPALANDIGRIQQFMQSANDNVATAAAAEEPTE